MFKQTDILTNITDKTQKDKQTDRQISRQYMCAVQEDSGGNMNNFKS
jgi:hypothetical protein